MSAKVAVLAHNQPLSARASTHVKREVALLLVGRLCAEQITQSLIRMFPPDSAFPSLKASQFGSDERQIYIPEKMPPRDVPGVFFQEPQSAQWQRDHRTVTFMPRECL